MKPVKDPWYNMLGRSVVVASDEAISLVPPDVKPHVRQTGYLHLDQYYWGSRIYRSRLGPKPIWRSRLTAPKPADAIREAVSDQRMNQKAKAVSKMIDPQKSLNRTVTALLTGTKSKELGVNADLPK